MAQKIRRIYKGNQLIDYVELNNYEPTKIVAVDSTGKESIVYSKQNLCTITITYGTTILEYKVFQGQTLESIAATLNESAINTAITGQSFLYWYILNNGVEDEITPSSSSLITDCLKNITVNGDMTITAIYNLNTYTLIVYDFDHTTILQTITVAYGTSYEEGLIKFNEERLTSPNINTKLYYWSFNGWTLEKGSNIVNDSLYTTKITSNTYIYPCFNVGGKIPYTLIFMMYNDAIDDYQFDASITCYYDECYNDAISRQLNPEENVLSYITDKDCGSYIRVYNTEHLFYSPYGSNYITKDTLLSSIPSGYTDSKNIYLYIGYTDITKTYLVKLYDEVSGTFLYQNASIIHGTKIATIENLGTLVSNIQSGNFKSASEETHYDYTYWLEYSDGTIYTSSDTVTNNILLYIRYTKTPHVYTITFKKKMTTTDINGNSSTTTTTITTTTATYDTEFSLPNSCYLLLDKSTTEQDDEHQIVTNYASEYISSSNSSRQFTGSHTLKCIGEETFIISGTIRYTGIFINMYLYDQKSLYPGTSETLVTEVTLTNTDITTFYATIADWANLTGEEYKTGNLYFYNTPGTFKIRCVSYNNVTTEYTADALEVASGHFDDLPASISGASKIYVYITTGIICASMVTVTWINQTNGNTIKQSTVQKGRTYNDLTYPSAPSVSGYTFSSWSPEASSTTQIFNNVNIYARYTKNSTTPSTPTSPGIYVIDSSGNYTKIVSLTKSGSYVSMVPVNTTVSISSSTKSASTGWIKATFTIQMIPLNDFASTSDTPRMFIARDSNYVTSKGAVNDMPAGFYSDEGDLFIYYNTLFDTITRSFSCTAWAKDANPSYNESWSGPINIMAGVYEGFIAGSTYSDSTHDYVTLKLTYKTPTTSESD